MLTNKQRGPERPTGLAGELKAAMVQSGRVFFAAKNSKTHVKAQQPMQTTYVSFQAPNTRCPELCSGGPEGSRGRSLVPKVLATFHEICA